MIDRSIDQSSDPFFVPSIVSTFIHSFVRSFVCWSIVLYRTEQKPIEHYVHTFLLVCIYHYISSIYFDFLSRQLHPRKCRTLDRRTYNQTTFISIRSHTTHFRFWFWFCMVASHCYIRFKFLFIREIHWSTILYEKELV